MQDRQQTESDVYALANDHGLFSTLVERNGIPPIWRRSATFGTMVRLILEQQVSLASANAAFGRLEHRVGVVTPERFLPLSDEDLRSDGFSRQKTSYVRGIADQMLSGDLDLENIAVDRDRAMERLVAVRGIGKWTASCFLLFVAGRRDIWPTGDRALYVSMSRNLDLDPIPASDACDLRASAWSPYRSTAARMLWHDYLGGRSYVPSHSAGFIDGTGRVHS